MIDYGKIVLDWLREYYINNVLWFNLNHYKTFIRVK